MIYHIDKTHPRVSVKDKISNYCRKFNPNIKAGKSKFVKHPVFETKTGMHWFNKASRHSEFTTYGVGMTLYFQFLKFLAVMFFILALINVPAFIFFSGGNSSSLEQSKDL